MKIIRSIGLLTIVLMFSAGIAYSADISKGKSLFNNTKLGTNGKSCNSCHPDGSSIDGSKSSFSILGSEQSNIEDAANFCIEMALSGKALDKSSDKMKDLVSYLSTLKPKSETEAPGY